MTSPAGRHLHAVDSAGDLAMRIALAKSLLGHRSWPGCEKNARLVQMALDGATISQLQAEDRREQQA